VRVPHPSLPLARVGFLTLPLILLLTLILFLRQVAHIRRAPAAGAASVAAYPAAKPLLANVGCRTGKPDFPRPSGNFSIGLNF